MTERPPYYSIFEEKWHELHPTRTITANGVCYGNEPEESFAFMESITPHELAWWAGHLDFPKTRDGLKQTAKFLFECGSFSVELKSSIAETKERRDSYLSCEQEENSLLGSDLAESLQKETFQLAELLTLLQPHLEKRVKHNGKTVKGHKLLELCYYDWLLEEKSLTSAQLKKEYSKLQEREIPGEFARHLALRFVLWRDSVAEYNRGKGLRDKKNSCP